jgi:hypothetical protein
MGFRTWVERLEDTKPLVHKLEVGWLKDSPKNKAYAALVVPGKAPYPDVFQVHADGKDLYVFPRPGSTKFVKAVSTFADLYMLTHSDGEYAHKVVEGMRWGPYFKGIFSTHETEPGGVADKLNLSCCPWVLVDNLATNSVEIVNKLRILGLRWPNLKPKEEARKITAYADPHFVDVEDWVPTVDQYDDYDLWRALPKIKHKLGLGDLK